MKTIFVVLWKIIAAIAWLFWKIIAYTFFIVYWILKFIFKLIFKRKYKTMKNEPGTDSDLIYNADESLSSHELMSLPLEESEQEKSDYEKNVFTVTNPEGELYEIDTSVPGPFFGENWREVFLSYAQGKVITARLNGERYAKKTGEAAGYNVLIGPVKAFMPYSHAMHQNEHRPIATLVRVISLDPGTRNVVVSSREAYRIVFSKKQKIEPGQWSDGVYWDYNEEEIRILVPGRILAILPRKETALSTEQIESLMATTGRFLVTQVDIQQRLAWVRLNQEQPAVSSELRSE